MRKFANRLFALLFFLIPLFTGAQITGIVTTNNDNTPLSDVTIIIKETKTATKTNQAGYYSIQAQKGQTLVFTYVDYARKEISVGDNNTINATMVLSQKQLGEVVVTAYGVKKQTRGLGQATQSLKGEEVAETQRDNWMNAITGKIAGATVNTTSGSPGASSQIVLRGFNSIGGDNSALIVLDGVPLNNAVNSQHRLASDGDNRSNDYTNRAADINPDDIESITVLKGPEAAALYGIEAGNGAIIITTKKGKAQKLKVSYENNFRWEQITKFHEVQKVYDNGSNGAFANTTRSFFGPKYAAGTKFYNNSRNFFNIGKAFKHSITLEGGKGATAIRATGSYYNQEGVIPNTGNKKINARITMTTKVNNKIELNTTAAYYNQFNRKAFRGTGGYYLSLLTWPLDDDARKWQNIAGNRRIISKSAGVDNPAEANNPFFETTRNKNYDINNRFTFNHNITLTANDWLSFDVRVGADVYKQNGATYLDRESFNVYTVGGRIEEYNIDYKAFNSNILATVKKNFGDFKVKFLAGQSFDDRTTTSWATQADSVFDQARTLATKDVKVNGYTSLLKRLNSRTQGRDTLTLQRSIGLFGDLSISYKDLIYLNASGRNDWLAEFPPAKRSYFYPALSTSFVFSDLLPKNNILTLGRLRASIAKTGKRVAPYSNQSVYTNAVSSTNGYGYAYGFGANNPDLFPEQQRTVEVGTELVFLNNRISLDVAAYKIDIKKSVAANARPSYATGFILYTSNIADLYNKGLEASLNVKWIKNKTIGWSTVFNFNKMENKVTSLPLPEFYNADSWLAGYRASLYRGLPTTTIGGINYLRNNKGQILIDPALGYPVSDPNYVNIGDRNPDFVMGIVNNFNYKNLKLSFTLDWKNGGDVLNGTEQQLVIAGLSTRTLDRELVRIIPGVLQDGLQNTANPTVNTIPINPFYQNDYYTGRTFAVDFVEHDVNWLRLRDVTLSYAFGKKMLYKARLFSAISVFVTGTDLFIITNYSGVDPAANGNTPATGGVGAFAIDLGNTPTPIGINAGLRVSFKNGK
ncbi:MAG: SusC/RagA family TonB-linked outer membrane protein [Ferruginibacter sp.]|nr:SusC/RagA family TonB-linked outer membrane protein [Ferruginibacter sp.]